MNLDEFLREGKRIVDHELQRALPTDPTLPERLVEAMRYGLLGEAKRIRALLVLAIADVLGTAREKVFPLVCAVEMVHACSLILDDLPCMDDAEVRRGRPATHRVFGEAVAILAAFALLNRGYRLLSEDRLLHVLHREAIHRLTGRLTQAVGPDGMIGGQAAELEPGSGERNLSSLEYIHSRKTGSLFTASAEMVAIACGAGEKEVRNLRSYAKNLGLAFQINDDLLDHLGNPDSMGKPVRQDSGKFNFVSLCGVEGSRKLVGELTAAARRAIKPLMPGALLLEEFAEFMRTRDR